MGVGQSEVDIARLGHTIIAVEAPGMGDDIQAIKAGLLEIADIIVVNKADKLEANKTASTLKSAMALGHSSETKLHHHSFTFTPPSPPVCLG